MLPARLQEATKADFERLIREQVAEDAEIEFKRDLPSRDDRPDPWLAGQNEVGENAKRKVLAELIAFANTFGGTVLVGIDETDERPARAAGITPIPRCQELAERFRLICRDLIEPRVPLIEVEGISTEQNGSGVLVLRVPASRSAPHRHMQTRECYFRHGDRSEKMTMREIQDLTLRRERSLAAVDTAFDEMAGELEAAVGWGLPNFQKYGISISAFPTSPLFLGRIFRNEQAWPMMGRLVAGFENVPGEIELLVPHRFQGWKPKIGGLWTEGGNNRFNTIIEARDNGLINYRIVVEEAADQQVCHFSWVMGAVGNCFLSVEKLRGLAPNPMVEFAIEVLIYNDAYPLQVMGYGREHAGPLGEIPIGKHKLPRYTIFSADEMVDIAAEIETDLWAAAGRDWPRRMLINF
jgi:Putative DNA-binding domain